MIQRPASGGRDRADERAVSEILGAILVFGLVLALVVLIQVSAVPALNQQVEYDHSERLQNDMGELGSTIERVQATDSTESVAVELGVRYPNRLFLSNPRPVQGTLATGSRGTITVDGAVGTGESRDFWDGTQVSYPTRAVVYSTDYREYRGAQESTTYEHGIVANTYPDSVSIVQQARAIVQGDNINIITVSGAVNETDTRQTTVPVTPIAHAPRTVPVTGNGSDITITLETTLSEDAWREVLEDELDDGNVEMLSYTAGSPATVDIVLNGSVTYDLRAGMVGVGSTLDETQPTYLERLDGGGSFVPVGASDRLAVEVRDQFNAPRSGIDVRYEVVTGNGTFAGDTTPADQSYIVTSTANGLAEVVFSPTTSEEIVVEATASLNAQAGTQATEVVRFNVSATAGTGGGDGSGDGGINPADDPSVKLDSSSRSGRTVTLTFENLNTATAVEWSEVRVPFYGRVSGAPAPTSVDITPQGKNTITTDIGDGFQDVTPSNLTFDAQGGAGDSKTVDVTFQGGPPPQGGDFVVFSARYASGGADTYFINLRN